jgi:capsid assembly protease
MVRETSKPDGKTAAHVLLNVRSLLANRPLMITRTKLDVILSVLADRLGFEQSVGAFSVDAEPARRVSRDAVQVGGTRIIEIFGSLVHRDMAMDPASGFRSYLDIADDFQAALDDPSVDSIMLDIDSPGGEANGVFDLADMIHSNRGKKRIYASANESAFSAAYMIGSAADKLFLSRSAGVGSIGVIAVHIDESEKNQKEGVKPTIITSGDLKGAGNHMEPLSDDAAKMIQSEVNRLYGFFKSDVARNRGVSEETIDALQGKPVFGDEAVKAGLADGIETFDAAMEMLTNDASNAVAVSVTASNPSKLTEVTMSKDDTQGDGGNQNVVAFSPDQQAQVNAMVSEAVKANADQAAALQNEAAERAKSITGMCKLAGKPELAGEFITGDLSAEQVRDKLLTDQAVSDERTSTRSAAPAEITKDVRESLNPKRIYSSRAAQCTRQPHLMRPRQAESG